MFLQLHLAGLTALIVGVASQQDVQISTNPSSVWVGHTDQLSVNCSFRPLSQDFSALSFLMLSKTDTEFDNNFKELATVPGRGGNSIDITNNLGANVDGKFQVQGESFVSFEWSQPADVTKGKYRCEAHGLDRTGHPISYTGLAMVDGKVAEYDLLKDMINQVNSSLQGSTAQIESDLKLWLQNYTSGKNNQTDQLTSLTTAVSSLQSLVNNITVQVNSNTTAQLNKLFEELIKLDTKLVNNSYLQAVKTDDLQSQLDSYKSDLNASGVEMKNQAADILRLDLLISQKDGVINNQSVDIDLLKNQVDNLENSAANQTASQTAVILDLQNQVGQNNASIIGLKNIIASYNSSLISQQQQINGQAGNIQTLINRLDALTHVVTIQSDLLTTFTSQMSDLYTRINNSKEAIFYSSFTYGNHTYYVSTPFWRNVPLAESLCQLHGGHLVQIDDHGEMNAISQHLQNSHDLVNYKVFISGSDELTEGVWMLGINGGPSMRYFNWAPGFPSTSVFENCIMLDKNAGWKMENTKCESEEWDRFICEIE